MVEMTKAEGSKPVSTKDWSFDFGDLDAAIAPAVADAIQTSLEQEPPHADMPFPWSDSNGIGGKPDPEPDAVYFYLRAFSEEGGMGPAFRTTISEMLEGALWEDYKQHQAKYDESGYRDRLLALRDKLVSMVTRIDQELEPD